ncbi:MAG: DUF21 domain-containing protein [Pirellulaceae bacterium]|nr:DUF21 domain-containing protein [Pirellulaceae bacterium]
MGPVLYDILPWLLAMLVLIGLSAFFSASEAALFSLRWTDRRILDSGRPGQQVAAGLLRDPERLLSAVLFWNLATNMAYFAIVSIVSLRLSESSDRGDTWAAVFGTVALLTLIFCSEMLPKSLAVLSARWLAGLVGIPLAFSVRVVDPLMPLLRIVNLLSQRLIWPGFKPEPYLEVADLERVIELSSSDAQLVEHERTALQNIVMLSDLRADEWMRPRSQFRTFRPPVTLADLNGQMTPSGYLLVSETSTEEVAGAVNLRSLTELPAMHLERLARPVLYVPWCNQVSDVLQQLHQKQLEVAAVVNEFGETIGVLTMEDLLDTVFTVNPSRSGRLLKRHAIHQVEPGLWHVTGMASVRRLAKFLGLQPPAGRSVTVAGMVEESLQRLARVDDTCDWGPFQLRVLEAPQRGSLLVELRRRETEEDGG